eukprot:CAMPEP_0185183870 /NCGR_PEP_ID=MMETSP1140-20130426/2225_1 /TAXON_ID=298111 /ORGANISM="Pavlova sp., Strain CCMP459" /LENGTH=68 /DNA_ID=CAMNT_0027749899 /DNA_START=494 /DNA_END=700 /DNA_ORIENTATION=-
MLAGRHITHLSSGLSVTVSHAARAAPGHARVSAGVGCRAADGSASGDILMALGPSGLAWLIIISMHAV